MGTKTNDEGMEVEITITRYDLQSGGMSKLLSDVWSIRSPMYDSSFDLIIRTTPDKLAEFLYLRNDRKMRNSMKSLNLRLFKPTKSTPSTQHINALEDQPRLF